MSCPITVYFVKDNYFVGVGFGNLGFIPDDTKIPGRIFDAWHEAVEFFAEDSEHSEQHLQTLRTTYGHCFSTREELFGYQFVVIPKLNLIVRRQLVHDLLTQKVSSEQFVQMVEDLEFELKDHQWEAIAELSNIQHIKRNLKVDSSNYVVEAKEVIVRMYHWLKTYDPLVVCDPLKLDAKETERPYYVRYMMNWFRGAISPMLVSSTLHEVY